MIEVCHETTRQDSAWGLRLRVQREAMKLSQFGLADLCGFKSGDVIALEAGRASCDWVQLFEALALRFHKGAMTVNWKGYLQVECDWVEAESRSRVGMNIRLQGVEPLDEDSAEKHAKAWIDAGDDFKIRTPDYIMMGAVPIFSCWVGYLYRGDDSVSLNQSLRDYARPLSGLPRPARLAADIRVLRRDLQRSQTKENDLIGACIRAIDKIDDFNTSAYDREQEAAAILETAIGRKSRL